MPIAFCFLLINVVAAFVFWAGPVGLEQVSHSLLESLTYYPLLPIPLFVLMGEVMFHSGIAPRMIGTIEGWLGRLPGRLSFLAVASGTLFSALSGSSIAATAVLGGVLVPEMEKRGYKKPMSLGPVLGSGGLATMIPPSMNVVFLAVVADISTGRLLFAAAIPGLLMAAFYAIYIITRCYIQPSLAPAYEVAPVPLSKKLVATLQYILPLGFIIFMVTGVIFLGVATPSEAAATGALSCFILAAAYRRLNWEVVKKSVNSAMRISVMIFLIIAAAKAYSQILAFTGASRGIVEFAAGLDLSPILILIAMQVAGFILGMIMPIGAMVMISIPLYMPVVHALGFDPVWFGAIYVLNLEMAATSPPYGCNLFVMKEVAPPGTTLTDCYGAALPFLGCDLIVMALLIAFPAIALWLPSIMR